jgi:hypothetical protein
MRDDQHQFLSLVGQAPARLTAEQVAWVLGCQPHDVPILVAARLLKPLGNPTPSCVKYFSRLEVLDLAQDRNWLVRATNAVNQHWQRKNARKEGHSVNSSQDGHVSFLDKNNTAHAMV